MSTLNTKLGRDLRHIWPQALAIALVIAGAVATLLLAVGSYRSLEETRTAYYERYGFADVFVQLRRAPKAVVGQIAELPGIAIVEPRIAKLALIEIPGFREPATGQFISLPDDGEPRLNRIHMRSGRLPDPARVGEVVVTESFAQAHGFAPGSKFLAILNGRQRELLIVGIALSPEFIYAVGPGDIMPDNRRYGVVWMAERQLASLYDLEGAFSSLALKLRPDASLPAILADLDRILEPYGSSAAHARRDQTSHAWLDHELDMLRNMSRTLPPIFLLVGAFLVHLTTSRLVALQREQIGLLKAVGYSNLAVGIHYASFVLVIALAGVAMGSLAGTALGAHVTGLFGEFFRFPFLVFASTPDLYAGAAMLGVAAAAAGAGRSLVEALQVAPAVAMQPAPPPVYRRIIPSWLEAPGLLPQPVRMTIRNMGRHPVRAVATMLGMSFATAILVLSLFTRGTMDELIDVTYFLADRQDATVAFTERRTTTALHEVARLPGVLAVEPFRAVPARVRFGTVERRVTLTGRVPDADLSRIIDINLRPVRLPEAGLAISAMLGRVLGVQGGDTVEVDLLEGRRRTVRLEVSALVEDYFGLRAMMDNDALSRLMREAPSQNGTFVSLDATRLEAFFTAVKVIPGIAGIALKSTSLANFREAVALLITTMAGIYTVLAVIIAFGVMYNSARIGLSERARELASLRVLGFTENEVLSMLLLELGVLVALAQPVGWAIGYLLAWFLQQNLAGELMRVRLVVEGGTYAIATAISVASAGCAALVVRSRIQSLNLVSVLKTRD